MKNLPTILLTILGCIFFPITLLYCAIHTMGKELRTFVGSLVFLIIGVVGGVWLYMTHPEIIHKIMSFCVETFAKLFN